MQLDHLYRNERGGKQASSGVPRQPSSAGAVGRMKPSTGQRMILAIVFTDIKCSVRMNLRLGDDLTDEAMDAHFRQSRQIIARHQGWEIKSGGDSVLSAFYSAEAALDYARALRANPGHPELQGRVRAGVHVGPVTWRSGDISGQAVNFAARVVSATGDARICLSDLAKTHIDCRARRYGALRWRPEENVPLKGFPGTHRLWWLIDVS